MKPAWTPEKGWDPVARDMLQEHGFGVVPEVSPEDMLSAAAALLREEGLSPSVWLAARSGLRWVDLALRVSELGGKCGLICFDRPVIDATARMLQLRCRGALRRESDRLHWRRGTGEVWLFNGSQKPGVLTVGIEDLDVIDGVRGFEDRWSGVAAASVKRRRGVVY